MFTTKSGEKIFVVDAHTHLWDGSPANQKNIHGKQFIDCFYDYHHLGPDSYIWPKEKFERYTEEDFVKDVFEQGYADVAIFNPQYLGDFYHSGFSNLQRNEAFRQQHPDRVPLKLLKAALAIARIPETIDLQLAGSKTV